MKDKARHSGQPETPWGWVVTAAVFGCNALAVGYYRAFGVFFVEIMDTFHSSTSITSLIMGVQSAVLSISALVVHNVLLPVMGERRSALVGGCLMATGMMITTFATSVTFLIFSLSVLVGLGNAMTYGPGLVLLGQYFDRRRALAMSVANTGSSVGSMTLPLLATYLLQHYGLSGAWLLYGAVTLNLVVFASLYRPVAMAMGSSSSQGLLRGKRDLLDGEVKEKEEDGSCSKPLLKEKAPQHDVKESSSRTSLKDKGHGEGQFESSSKTDANLERNKHVVPVGPSSETQSMSDYFGHKGLKGGPEDDVESSRALLRRGEHGDTMDENSEQNEQPVLLRSSETDKMSHHVKNKRVNSNIERYGQSDKFDKNQDKSPEQNRHAVHMELSSETSRLSNHVAVKTETDNILCSDKHELNGSRPLVQRCLANLGEGSTARTFCSSEDVSSDKRSTTTTTTRIISNNHLRGRRSSTLGDLRIPSLHHPKHSGGGSSSNLSAVLQRRLKDVSLHASHPYLMIPSPSLQSLSQELHGGDSSTTPGEPDIEPSQRRDGCNGGSVFGSSSLDRRPPRPAGGSSTALEEAPGRRRSPCGELCSKIACDGKLLCKPLFWLVQAYVCVGVVGATSAGVYLPALCLERGLDKRDTALVLTIWGGLNLAGRLLCGVLADRQWLRPSHISLLSLLVIGLLFQLVPLLPLASLGSMVALGAVYGVFEGAYFTMLPLIIIDFVSQRHFSSTFGFVQLSQAGFATVFYPLLGRLRDVTGNYYATFHCLGACALMASLLLLLESGVRALRTRRTSEEAESCSH